MGNNIEKQEFFGIHSVLPDGNSLYLLEDGEYVQKDKDSFFEKRGNHRLSKWKVSYDDTKEIPVKVN